MFIYRIHKCETINSFKTDFQKSISCIEIVFNNKSFSFVN